MDIRDETWTEAHIERKQNMTTRNVEILLVENNPADLTQYVAVMQSVEHFWLSTVQLSPQ